MEKYIETIITFIAIILTAGCQHSFKSMPSRGKVYSFYTWNPASMDTIKIAFQIDSSFFEAPRELKGRSGGDNSYSFYTSDSYIYLVYFNLYKEDANSSTRIKNIIYNLKSKLKEAFPERTVKDPVRVYHGKLEGVKIESRDKKWKIINYIGINNTDFVSFDLELGTRDQQVNPNEILNRILASIFIE